MSNYTKSTNFATKDNLSPGNPLKIVKGTEIDTEYNNIATAVATKTDNSAAAITGGSITGITDLAVADGGTGASTAANALNNLLPSQTSNANKYLQTDGTNASWDAVSLSTADITGTLGVANGGTGVTTSTGTTNVVLSNSPTLVTPDLGTPSSATLTNATGLPISTGVSGLGTNVATFLGTPSSANLASAVTDETGSGALVFATSPTLVTPALGTPSALVGTNITGTAAGLTAGNVTTNANLTGGVTSVGNAATVVTNANLTGAVTSVGNASSLGSFTSAQLLGALTDETGTGSAVFATSPVLVTPNLGTPSAAVLTSATGLPLTTGVTGLLPVANGGTATATPSIVAGTNITVTGTWPNQTIAASGGSGTVTSVDVSGGTTGLTTSGGPVTSSGTVTLAGTLAVANGGTGQTSYTNGQLLIGNTTGNTLTKATLTQGSGITITNSAGAITIASTGGSGTVTSASVVSANGFAGTVATATTTPAITLSTSITGVLKGNGTAISAATAGTDYVTPTGTETLTNKTLTSPTLTTPALGTPSSGTLSSCTVDGTDAVGFRNIPQNSQSAAYTLVLTDAGKHIFHPVGDNNARTFTIPANSSVAYPIGTAITFINMAVANVTISITTDTLTLSPAGTTGSRTLATNGSATCIKITSTSWLISGSGLT